ncbi:hypothetical protein [Pseudoxanthomonas mexicana]
MEVGADGVPTSVEVGSGSRDLDRAAVNAVHSGASSPRSAMAPWWVR